MLSLPLTNRSQQRKTARHCRTPMKSNIVILTLRSKQYYRVVTVLYRVVIRSRATEPDIDIGESANQRLLMWKHWP